MEEINGRKRKNTKFVCTSSLLRNINIIWTINNCKRVPVLP